ncbi:MAG: aminotransferase class V-fold PLP-dependent enzyme [Pseudomonadota bacterium]|nr:aminotransferase class V-fold PLP-dependent enzyme [Pseudomonadota bacterium]
MTFSYQRRLFCPGPTPMPTANRHLLTVSDYHRQDEFVATFQACRQHLASLCHSKHYPALLTTSGTGVMEAAVVSLTNPHDKVLVIAGGKFGQRFQKLADIYNCDTTIYKPQPREGLDLTALETILTGQDKFHALFLQANETSTGIHYPLAAVAERVHKHQPDCLLVVDAISSIIAHEIRIDGWGLDCVIGAAHKGFGMPPSLSYAFLSERAKRKSSTRPRFYLDLHAELRQQESGNSRFTPAISTVIALKAVLDDLHNIGTTTLVKRHALLAKACHAAIKALGLQLYALRQHSAALTNIILPPPLKAQDFCAYLRATCQVQFAGGQTSDASTQILRLSHLGYVDPFDLVAAITALELGLKHFGVRFQAGAGVAAAVAVIVAGVDA